MFHYSTGFENQSVSAVQDLIEITASSAVPVTIHRIELSWAGTTQEICRVQLLRRTTVGSGGTGVTPRALHARNTVAAACTAVRNVTTPGSAGDVLWQTQQNLVVPIDELFGLESLKIVVPAGGRIALNLASAPGSARNASCTIFFSEG